MGQKEHETIWLFDTRADAHVMPKHVWEQLGEPSLLTTGVTLRGANEQDLGAMGEVQVRGFIGKNQSSFTAVVARDARRCLQSGTQLRTKGYTQPKGVDVTRRTQGHSQSCMLKPRDAKSVTSVTLKREKTHWEK